MSFKRSAILPFESEYEERQRLYRDDMRRELRLQLERVSVGSRVGWSHSFLVVASSDSLQHRIDVERPDRGRAILATIGIGIRTPTSHTILAPIVPTAMTMSASTFFYAFFSGPKSPPLLTVWKADEQRDGAAQAIAIGSIRNNAGILRPCKRKRGQSIVHLRIRRRGHDPAGRRTVDRGAFRRKARQCSRLRLPVRLRLPAVLLRSAAFGRL